MAICPDAHLGYSLDRPKRLPVGSVTF